MAENPIGEGGWPLGVTDPDPATARRRFQRTMHWLQERWRAGDLTAFDKAIHECRLHGEVVPEWLEEAAADVVRLAMSENERRSRREWDRHVTRWEAVVELYERSHDPSDRLFNDDRGTSLERAYAAVSGFLKRNGKWKGNTARAVRQSYELVEAAGGADATYQSYMALRRGESG